MDVLKNVFRGILQEAAGEKKCSIILGIKRMSGKKKFPKPGFFRTFFGTALIKNGESLSKSGKKPGRGGFFSILGS